MKRENSTINIKSLNVNEILKFLQMKQGKDLHHYLVFDRRIKEKNEIIAIKNIDGVLDISMFEKYYFDVNSNLPSLM